MDRRVTNGLAWAGLFVVVGVPAADLLSAQFLGDPERVAVISPQAPLEAEPATVPVKTAAAAAPAAPVATQPSAPRPQAVAAASDSAAGDPVDSFLQAGKKLPSYITGSTAAAPAAASKPVPAPVTVAPAATAATPAVPRPAAPIAPSVAVTEQAGTAPVSAPVEVASLQPQKVAPVPMPLSMRPRPQQVPVAAVQPRNEPVVIPPEVVFGGQDSVDAEDLDEWETGPLADFLRRRQARSGSNANYEQEFYPEEPVRSRRDRLIGPVERGFYSGY